MSHAPDPLPQRAGPSWGVIGFLAVFLALPIVIELTLQAADARLVGSVRLRAMAYQYGAFWPGLLDNWTPNYPAQPWSMFVSYLFLHTGFWHLAGNMLTFALLFHFIRGELGGRRLAVIYLVSAMGGALGFALLGTQFQPMVGSSGALFGLVAAWRWRDWVTCDADGKSRFHWALFARDTLGVVVINAVMWVSEGGALAWEAHLGGYIAGVLAMLVWPSKTAA